MNFAVSKVSELTLPPQIESERASYFVSGLK